MKHESLSFIIYKILRERAEYASIPHADNQPEWYASDVASGERFKEYESLIDMLGLPVTTIFIPGKERPTGGSRNYRAGQNVTADEFLSDLFHVSADTEDEIAAVYQATDIRRGTVFGKDIYRAKAPNLPAGLHKDAYPALVDFIIKKIREADRAGLTIIMPERAGVERDADPEWLLHDIGHIMELESRDFNAIFRPLTTMGAEGLRALSSIRNAGHVARVGTEEASGFDYGPQALVNMYVRGKGESVVLAGAESNLAIKRIQGKMTREIKKRLVDLRGVVNIW